MRKVTDAQVRKLMEEMNTHGKAGHTAMTARKYIVAGKLPSEMGMMPNECENQSCG